MIVNPSLSRSLLIVSTLSKENPEVKQAITTLSAEAADYKVIHTEELNIKPCIGCNACWLKTPGILCGEGRL